MEVYGSAETEATWVNGGSYFIPEMEGPLFW